MSLSDMHIVAPTKDHTHTVIFLHGRDSTAAEFAPEFFESQASDERTLLEIFPSYKWVFPTSKLRASARFRTEMSQWFDMWSVENPEVRNELQIDGLKKSIAYIMDVINAEASSIALDHIILCGISQGCATAISVLLYSGIRVGAFIGLCSWLPFQEKLEGSENALEELRSLFMSASDNSSTNSMNAQSLESALATPVFLSHSKDDDVVPIQNGRRLSQGLKDLGMAVTWKEYDDGGHWVNEPQGVDDMVLFLQNNAGMGATTQ